MRTTLTLFVLLAKPIPPKYVAPTNDFSANERHVVTQITHKDIPVEGKSLFRRRCPEKHKVSFLAGDDIERTAKPCKVRLGKWSDFSTMTAQTVKLGRVA